MNSKTAHDGDAAELRLDENLIINDVVVIPAGTKVRGVVTLGSQGGRTRARPWRLRLWRSVSVVYNEGLRFDAEITADVDLNVPLENLREAMDESKPHGVSITIQ